MRLAAIAALVRASCVDRFRDHSGHARTLSGASEAVIHSPEVDGGV